MDRRPLRPPLAAKAGSSRRAASIDSSSTTCQPISLSPAVGRSAAISAMRACQRGRSALMAATAITGLHVAPTAPLAIEADSCTGSAESFHNAVWGKAAVMRLNGVWPATAVAALSVVSVTTRLPGSSRSTTLAGGPPIEGRPHASCQPYVWTYCMLGDAQSALMAQR